MGRPRGSTVRPMPPPIDIRAARIEMHLTARRQAERTLAVLAMSRPLSARDKRTIREHEEALSLIDAAMRRIEASP